MDKKLIDLLICTIHSTDDDGRLEEVQRLIRDKFPQKIIVCAKGIMSSTLVLCGDDYHIVLMASVGRNIHAAQYLAKQYPLLALPPENIFFYTHGACDAGHRHKTMENSFLKGQEDLLLAALEKALAGKTSEP